MALEIIGAGFGRTSTMSLKLALEQLGFGPCYHMMEVTENEGHDQLWLDAVEGRPVDWDALFERYRSAVDWPVARFWPELSRHYGEAKVVLSTRDVEGWYESMTRTIFKVLARDPEAGDPKMLQHRRMTRKLIQEVTFGGRWEDREHVIAVYQANVAKVLETIPAERLLIYEVGSGWEPLCGFLGVDVPCDPYPRVNDTREFRENTGLDE